MPPQPQDGKSLVGAIEKEVKPPIKQEEPKKIGAPLESKEPPRLQQAEPKADSSRDDAIDTTLRDPSKRASELDASESHPKETAEAATAAKKSENARKSIPLETVLQMGPPTVQKPEEHRPPHLQAPPYVHHFDTFTLVRDLERGGFTEDQSVTTMKAVRGLLAINLDVAKEGLVSKSDVENVRPPFPPPHLSPLPPHNQKLTPSPQETYLFRAACSELRTEILNTRASTTTKTHTQLSHLHHTTDILSQRVSQETLALRDDLRGMLNDRRMSVRMQHQMRDVEIQELNNMISVRLNSDSKSEVEGLRWVLTRRAAMAIGVMALLILGSLRYSSYKLHEREILMRKAGVEGGGGGGQSSSSAGSGGGSHTVQSREMGTQTGESGADGGGKAENVGYVSLG